MVVRNQIDDSNEISNLIFSRKKVSKLVVSCSHGWPFKSKIPFDFGRPRGVWPTGTAGKDLTGRKTAISLNLII